MCITCPTWAATNYDAHQPLADVSSGQESSDCQEDVLGPREHHHVQRRSGRSWCGLSDDRGTHRGPGPAVPATHPYRRTMSVLRPDPGHRGPQPRPVGYSCESEPAGVPRRVYRGRNGADASCPATRQGTVASASHRSHPAAANNGHGRDRRAKLAVSTASVRIYIESTEFPGTSKYSTVFRT